MQQIFSLNAKTSEQKEHIHVHFNLTIGLIWVTIMQWSHYFLEMLL